MPLRLYDRTGLLDELNRLLTDGPTGRKVRLLNNVLLRLLLLLLHIPVLFDLVRTTTTAADRTSGLYRLHLQLLRWPLEADRIALCVCGDVDRFLFDDGATTTDGTTATARCNHRGTGAAARHHRRSAGCDDRGTTGHRRPRVAYDHLARELRHQYLLALLVEENLLRRLPTLIRAHRALHRHLRKGRGGCLLLRWLLLLHDDDRLLPGATVLLALGEQYRLLQLGLRLRLLGHHVRLSLRVGGKDVLRRLRMLRCSQYGGLHERSARRCRRLL